MDLLVQIPDELSPHRPVIVSLYMIVKQELLDHRIKQYDKQVYRGEALLSTSLVLPPDLWESLLDLLRPGMIRMAMAYQTSLKTKGIDYNLS